MRPLPFSLAFLKEMDPVSDSQAGITYTDEDLAAIVQRFFQPRLARVSRENMPARDQLFRCDASGTEMLEGDPGMLESCGHDITLQVNETTVGASFQESNCNGEMCLTRRFCTPQMSTWNLNWQS